MDPLVTPGTIYVGLLSLIVPMIFRYFFYRQKIYGKHRPWRTVTLNNLQLIIENDVKLVITDGAGSDILISSLGKSIPSYIPYHVIETRSQIVVEWQKYAKLMIDYNNEGETPYLEIHWQAYPGGAAALEDHFEMRNAHWFGAGHVFNHSWPMEKWYANMGPFVSGEGDPFGVFTEYYGAVQERLWLNSNGIAIFVDFNIPLFVSVNSKFDHSLVLRSAYESPYANDYNRSLDLKYTICLAKDVKCAFESVSGKLFKRPEGIPDKNMFRYPIWSTWAQYHKDINQSKVFDFARDIRKHGFRDGQLEIDDDWTPHYGDWEFCETKFPDPKAMVQELKNMNFRVSIWVHPFASPLSKAFWEGCRHGNQLWLRNRYLRLPQIVSWWNGYAAVLDVTNTEARAWFEGKLKYLQNKYSIDTFKLDAGDVFYFSSSIIAKEPLETPNQYTKLFAEMSHRIDSDTRAQEVRVGVGAQNLPMFFRLQDKDSNWGLFNGLRTVIPHVLTQGLLGYPFVLPDMIGGNAYAIISSSAIPDRELFIRWIEVNALMPCMQFSIVPWQYDDDVVKIANNMCALHENYADKIIDLAEESTRTGAPILRPLWWIAPKDETSLTISSEFLVGDDLLVAPVLDKGARTRDVYLPIGTWRDELRDNFIEGGKWLRDYRADLEELPHFTKVS